MGWNLRRRVLVEAAATQGEGGKGGNGEALVKNAWVVFQSVEESNDDLLQNASVPTTGSRTCRWKSIHIQNNPVLRRNMEGVRNCLHSQGKSKMSRE